MPLAPMSSMRCLRRRANSLAFTGSMASCRQCTSRAAAARSERSSSNTICTLTRTYSWISASAKSGWPSARGLVLAQARAADLGEVARGSLRAPAPSAELPARVRRRRARRRPEKPWHQSASACTCSSSGASSPGSNGSNLSSRVREHPRARADELVELVATHRRRVEILVVETIRRATFRGRARRPRTARRTRRHAAPRARRRRRHRRANRASDRSREVELRSSVSREHSAQSHALWACYHRRARC